MPVEGIESLTQADRRNLAGYEVGYDWIPGRFGPPPGILRARKDQLDALNDRDFMNAVMKMGQEEKESLMISEAERLRTYTTLWPNPETVNFKDLAREGFYYTGISDRVQCAFCAGFLGNWERGDIPRESHKRFFSYCKMAQRKPCANIPLSNNPNDDLPPELKSLSVLSTRADSHTDVPAIQNLRDLGVEAANPYHPRYRVPSVRLGSYQYYNGSYPVRAEGLCEAGFYYEGPGDKVRCFWCDGALEMWSEGDDPWTEHAKWYPGCGFVQQTKGKPFIKSKRALMSAEDLSTAETLQYNNSGTDFLHLDDAAAAVQTRTSRVVGYDSYQICESLGFSGDQLRDAFSFNHDEDFPTVDVLIDVLLALRDNDEEKLTRTMQEVKSNKSADSSANCAEPFESRRAPLERETIDLNSCVRDGSAEMTDQRAVQIVAAMTCQKCGQEQVGAVLMPCGHLVLCHKCSYSDLPARCYSCGQGVLAACRVFLS